MFVKKHFSGLAISYAGAGGGKKSLTPTPSVKNSQSRLNRQKRAIHDAVEWMRQNATYKPLIFCLTVPVQSDWSMQNTNVSKFCENLKSTYGAKNYVWVREYTGGGRPHYHFVSDCPFVNAVHLSAYWSSTFGMAGRNTVRMGTNPNHPPVKYFVDSPFMARYLTKYLGKAMGANEVQKGERKIRTFGHSLECWQKSQPVTYQAEIFRNFSTVVNAWGEPVERLDGIERTFTLCENSEKELIEIYGAVPDHLRAFDDSIYSWINPNPLHKVYYGIPSRSKKSTQKKAVPVVSPLSEPQKISIPEQSRIIFS